MSSVERISGLGDFVSNSISLAMGGEPLSVDCDHGSLEEMHPRTLDGVRGEECLFIGPRTPWSSGVLSPHTWGVCMPECRVSQVLLGRKGEARCAAFD